MIISFLALVLCSAWTCGRQESNEEIVPALNETAKLCPENASYKENQGQISFEFRLMNTKGEITNCFKEGEDVLFQVLAVSKSDTALTWGDRYDNFDTGTVFQVYQKDNNGVEQLVSEPKKGVFCTRVLNIPIPAKDTVKMFTSWGNTAELLLNKLPRTSYRKNAQYFWHSLRGDNTLLKKGSYEVVFNFQITLIQGVLVFKNNGTTYDFVETTKESKLFKTTLNFQVN